MTSTIQNETVSQVPLSEVPAVAILAEIARRRAMPPMERLAAGHFVDADERLAYKRGRLAGIGEERAKAQRWLGSVPHDLPCGVRTWLYVRIYYPTRRLWRQLTGRPEYDDQAEQG